MKTFTYRFNFFNHYHELNRMWVWHSGMRITDSSSGSVYDKLSKVWDIPRENLWNILNEKIDDKTGEQYISEIWSFASHIHMSIMMKYAIRREHLPEKGFTFIIDLFGSDDEHLLTKLTAPSWILEKDYE